MEGGELMRDERIETALKMIDSLLIYNKSASKNETKMISCATIERELTDVRRELMKGGEG
jgi:hypothetical protein